MVLGISKESVSRMSSVFSLPGSLSSSVLSKKSNYFKYTVTLREDNLVQSSSVRLTVVLTGCILCKVYCNFFQTFCTEASRIRWYWGYRRNQSQECHLSSLRLDHYLLLSYQRNQIIWKGGIFHCHLPLRSADRTIGPWSNFAWLLRGSEVLHYPQVGGTEECQGNLLNLTASICVATITHSPHLRNENVHIQERSPKVAIFFPYHKGLHFKKEFAPSGKKYFL